MRSDNLNIIDFGISGYGDILSLQEKYFGLITDSKIKGIPGRETLMIGEHFPVITMGRRADERNILADENQLRQRGVEVYKTGRGGDVTYHCPGQLILYPILDLDKHGLGVKDYVDLLEESVIRLLADYGIKGERIPGATGVWIGKGTEEERKICAIGIKCSRFCTMHGLSLNVNSDLDGFHLINPCGFKDKGVTSMKKELGKELDMQEIKRKISGIFLGLVFSFEEILDFPE